MDDESYPYENAARLPGEVWEVILHLLQTRSGNRCEARTEDCLAAAQRGELFTIPRNNISIHHRVPRGRGGTRDIYTNTLSRLMLLCGTGTTGCHGWIESHRTIAKDNGWLIPRLTAERIDSAKVPMMAGGRTLVLLDDDSVFYRPFTHV